MCKNRPRQAQRFVERQIIWHAGDELLAANDVGDIHLGVVDDVGKIVGRVAVRLDEDEVVNDLRAGSDVTHDLVVVGIAFGLSLEPQRHGAIPGRRIVRAMVAVAEGTLFGLGGVAKCLNLLGRVGISIGAAGVN